jgi:hypothetical protein
MSVGSDAADPRMALWPQFRRWIEEVDAAVHHADGDLLAARSAFFAEPRVIALRAGSTT